MAFSDILSIARILPIRNTELQREAKDLRKINICDKDKHLKSACFQYQNMNNHEIETITKKVFSPAAYMPSSCRLFLKK